MKSKRPSGAADRKKRAAVEQSVAVEESQLAEYFKDVGPPPTDPIRTIVWCNTVSARCAWIYATKKLTQGDLARLKGILESVRSNGMTSSKAIDKERLRTVEERLGMSGEKEGDGLEKRPDSDPPALRG